MLTEVVSKVRGLLVAWPLGEQGGAALADVLLGRAEPTGRLAVTLLRADAKTTSHFRAAGHLGLMV